MRRWALAILAVLVVGCGQPSGGEESASCAAAVVWRDTVYFGARLPGPRPPRGERLDGGIQPACNDSNGEPPAEGRPTDLYRMEGVSPEVAVYAAGRKSLSAFYLDTDHGVRNVIVDARTRITGFDGEQMPILRQGDAVRIRGSCDGEAVGARHIAPQP